MDSDKHDSKSGVYLMVTCPSDVEVCPSNVEGAKQRKYY